MAYAFATKLLVFAKEGEHLLQLWQEFLQSEHFRTLEKIDWELFHSPDFTGESESLLKRVEDAVDDADFRAHGMLMILTDDDRVHRNMYAFKKRAAVPVTILRFWKSLPSLERTKSNRALYCRNTGVNFLLTRKDYEKNAGRKNDLLKLDNPVCLEQKATLGEDSEIKMLRHTIEALCSPERIDLFGRKKRNFGEIRLTVATHFYLDQENIDTVVDLLDEYCRYEPALLDRIQFVLVDDGSPIDYEIPEYNLNLTWIRITDNVPWNQAGAKNLCMLYARSNNVVISDVDHMFPESTLEWLLKRNAPNKRFYKFYRKDPDGKMKKGHPNLFYLSRGRWFELFGMDEEFSGGYGAEDFRFVKNMRYRGTVQRYLPKNVYCQIRSVDREKSYHSLVRDLSFNTPIDTRKRIEADWFGEDFGHSRINLDFRWSVLLDRRRVTTVHPSFDRAWRRRWLLRQFRSIVCPW